MNGNRICSVIGMRYLSLLFLVFYVQVGWSQLLDSTSVEEGKKMCFHRMQQGQTLFALSRLYKVGYSVIKTNNPDKGDEIALGDLIRIPCDLLGESVVDSAKIIVPQAQEDSITVPEGYRAYVIKAGETVYTLSRQNSCSIDSFMVMNPQVKKEGLKVGMTVFFEDTNYRAPIVKESKTAGIKPQEQSNVSEIVNDSLRQIETTLKTKITLSKGVDSNAFRIAVALPFLFDETKKKMEEVEADQEPEVHPQTKLFLDFYQGFSAGLDSLIPLGIKTQVFYYDTKGDSNVVKKLPQEFMKNGIHAVVGPAFDEHFMLLSSLLKGTKIKLVSPYGRDKAILINNPNAVKVLAAEESRVPVLAKYLHRNFRDSNLVFTYHNEVDKRLVETLLAELLSISLMEDSVIMSTPTLVKGIYEPLAKLKAGQPNLVVCLSRDESFVTKLAGKLHSRKEDYKLRFIGVDEWKDYKNLEALYWNDLKMMVVGNLDFRFLGVKQEGFFKDYYARFYTEPSYQAALGYDIATNLFVGIMGHTIDFSGLAQTTSRGCLSDYHFTLGAGNFGAENKVANVYQFSNYTFKQVSP